MELTKDIKFDKDELFKNETVKITYFGRVIQEHPEKVSIIYGFNAMWDDASEKEMVPSENGYEVEIELEDHDSLNFCFKNSNGEWDNNESHNYVVQIKEENTSLVATNTSELSLRPRLRKTYIWSKKIRLAVYKLMISLPRFITGNYRRRINL